MSSRAKKIVSLAVSLEESPISQNNISARPQLSDSNFNSEAITLFDTSNNYANNYTTGNGDSPILLDISNNYAAENEGSATLLDISNNYATGNEGSAMLLDSSNNYNIGNEGSSTLLNISNSSAIGNEVCKSITNDDISSTDSEEFSGDSSDSFEPSSSDDSSSCSSCSSSKSSDLGTESIVPGEIPIVGSEIRESEDNSPSIKKGKKRLRKTENWVSNRAKRLKNSGKSYKSRTGKMMEARKLGPPCPEKCVLACAKKVTENCRAKLFKEYWEMASLQRQRDFLGSCIEQIQLKYRRITAGVPRKPNSAFYIIVNGERVRVCKIFLINTLGITERTIRTVISARASGTGIVVEDKRGKHGKQRKANEEVIKSVRNHIDSIPRIESHYVRKDTTREFIDGGLSIAELHRHYSRERSSSQAIAAKYDMYARIFNTEYNIGFFVPKKDQCDLCESYKNSLDEDKKALETKYLEHVEEKELSREEKDKDKARAKNNEVMLVVYDLQAVLPIPTGQTSAFFYKSRLNCYNFTVS